MNEMIIAYMIWCALGILFSAVGVFAFFAKKALGFWANAEMFQVTDVKKYNAALGKLFVTFGIVFVILGLPLLSGQNSAMLIVSVFGVMAEVIIMMAIYILVIEKKYKKK